MDLTQRQEKILQVLIKEYIDSAMPISSDLLKKRSNLNVSPATIRNELQELTDLGYIMQPHTSAGRIPTEKGYEFFVEILFDTNDPSQYIYREIKEAKEKIEKELQLAQELTKSLSELSTTLSYTRLERKDSILEVLKIIGPSRTTYDKNISIIKELLDELEKF
jgi:heat-inducible transcriptional repressor